MNLSELFTFQRGCVISRIEHFPVKCGNCQELDSAIVDNFRSFPSGYEKTACKNIDKKYITQVNDIVIYIKAPFTITLINERNANLLVSSNYLILRSQNNKIKLSNFIAMLKKEILNRDEVEKNIFINTDMTIKVDQLKNYVPSPQQYLFMIGDIKLSKTSWNLLWTIIAFIIALLLVVVANTIYSSTSKPSSTNNFIVFLGIELALTILCGLLIIVFLFVLGTQNLWAKRMLLALRTWKQKFSHSQRIIDKMQVLDTLLQKQLISQEEYTLRKEKILKRLS